MQSNKADPKQLSNIFGLGVKFHLPYCLAEYSSGRLGVIRDKLSQNIRIIRLEKVDHSANNGARCVSLAPQGAISTIDGAQWGLLSASVMGTIKTRYRVSDKGQLKE